MKLVYLRYTDGVETRILIKDSEKERQTDIWAKNGTVAFFYPVNEESILKELSRCHDVHDARWLMEEVNFWGEEEEVKALPEYLKEAAAAIYAEDDAVKASKLTRAFLNEYLG